MMSDDADVPPPRPPSPTDDEDVEEELPQEQVEEPEPEPQQEAAAAPAEEPEDDHTEVELDEAPAEADDNLGEKIKAGLATAGKQTLKAGSKLQIRAWKKSGFLSWMGRGLGTTCARTWHLRSPGYNTFATLEHDCLTGRRQLSIGKTVVYQKTIFPDRSFEIWFDINGVSGKIAAENDYKDNALYYSCIFNNRPLQTTIFGAESAGAAAAPGVLTISIPETKVEKDGRLEVAYYLVDVAVEDGEPKRLKKRFSDFIDLHEKIWASYASHDLLKDIPKPPKKSVKLFKKHDDATFVENRRLGLEKFMQGLTTVPAIMSNLFLLDFLELHDASKGASGVDDKITIMDTIHTTLKFEAEKPAGEIWAVVSNWKDASWKGKGGETVQVDESGAIRKFTLDKPWGEVTEKRVKLKEEGEGGTLEYNMIKSSWPLRHFSCIVTVAHKKKMVRAKILVKLKFVTNPDEDVDALAEQLNTHVSDQFHALQSTR